MKNVIGYQQRQQTKTNLDRTPYQSSITNNSHYPQDILTAKGISLTNTYF